MSDTLTVEEIDRIELELRGGLEIVVKPNDNLWFRRLVAAAREGVEAREQKAVEEDHGSKSSQAYQVIGTLLHYLDIFESDEGQRALDYFSEDGHDKDFLPWPREEIVRPSPSPNAAEELARDLENDVDGAREKAAALLRKLEERVRELEEERDFYQNEAAANISAYGKMNRQLTAAQEREGRLRLALSDVMFESRGEHGGPLVCIEAHYEDGTNRVKAPEALKAARAALQPPAEEEKGNG